MPQNCLFIVQYKIPVAPYATYLLTYKIYKTAKEKKRKESLNNSPFYYSFKQLCDAEKGHLAHFLHLGFSYQ
jgi:hypothetical protein